jgi:hypothetical protein
MCGLSMTLMPSACAWLVTAQRLSSVSPGPREPGANQRKPGAAAARWNPNGVIDIQSTPSAASRWSERAESSDPYPRPPRIAWA